MKYFVIFLLCCVAVATAAPQLLAWPGYTGFGYAGYTGYAAPFNRAAVVGPTVVNGFGGRYIAPGYVY